MVNVHELVAMLSLGSARPEIVRTNIHTLLRDMQADLIAARFEGAAVPDENPVACKPPATPVVPAS